MQTRICKRSRNASAFTTSTSRGTAGRPEPLLPSPEPSASFGPEVSSKQKRKRAKSSPAFGERKRGEKWTQEEEALLRQRRDGEQESWEETGKHFAGRTTNALQKKWKLMMLSDKMRIEPEMESRLLEAVTRLAPDYYKKLAAELGWSEGEADLIEDKVSILYMQGKLPLRARASSHSDRASSRNNDANPCTPELLETPNMLYHCEYPMSMDPMSMEPMSMDIWDLDMSTMLAPSYHQEELGSDFFEDFLNISSLTFCTI